MPIGHNCRTISYPLLYLQLFSFTIYHIYVGNLEVCHWVMLVSVGICPIVSLSSIATIHTSSWRISVLIHNRLSRPSFAAMMLFGCKSTSTNGTNLCVTGNVAMMTTTPERSVAGAGGIVVCRSEEHTSELQSHSDLVCR